MPQCYFLHISSDGICRTSWIYGLTVFIKFSRLSTIISSHNFFPSSSPLELPITRAFGCLKCSHSSGMHYFFFLSFFFFEFLFSMCFISHTLLFWLLQAWNLLVTHPFFGAIYLIRIVTPLSTCCYCREGNLIPRTVRTLAAFSIL